MSTDYYLACKKCRECIHIAQDGFSGFTFYSGEPDCMRKLGEFLGGHNIGSEHDITLISEHRLDDDEEDRPYEEMEWTPKHLLPKQLIMETKVAKDKAPHVPAAFINAIAEEGTKAEAIQFLQETWNDYCEARDASRRWYAAASPYATPEALKEALAAYQRGGDTSV